MSFSGCSSGSSIGVCGLDRALAFGRWLVSRLILMRLALLFRGLLSSALFARLLRTLRVILDWPSWE